MVLIEQIHNTGSLRKGYYETMVYLNPPRSTELHTYLANIPHISDTLIISIQISLLLCF